MRIDLNADLAESFGSWVMGSDAELLDIVSSANIACGFHAGDSLIMLDTCAAAAERGISIGAHVSYRDLEGFGRRKLPVEPRRLYAEIVNQLGALQSLAKAAGTRVDYVKPHGALYNVIVSDPMHADAVVQAIIDVDSSWPLLGLPNSLARDLAQERGLVTWVEAFADRGYQADGTLVARGQPGALVVNPEVVAERVIDVVRHGKMRAVDGSWFELSPDSICIHGDSPGAVDMAKRVRSELEKAGVEISPRMSWV